MQDDQNQTPTLQTPPAEPTNDAAVSAPSAPVVPDPMVTPAQPAYGDQPAVGINGVPMENANVEPAPQVGPAKAAEPESVPTAASMMPSSPVPEPPVAGQDLATIKQQALQSLEPLVDKLEMAPEDKFKTLMMVIQASDKPEMLEKAFESANQISDEKTKAQALLDVVNEVNYFTQKQNANQ